MLTANIVFFALTAWKIIRVKRETKSSDIKNRQTDYNSNKDNAILVLRLFLMMGVGYILVGIPRGPGRKDGILRQCIDIFTSLQPVLMFVVLVLRARVRKLIKKRFVLFINDFSAFAKFNVKLQYIYIQMECIGRKTRFEY